MGSTWNVADLAETYRELFEDGVAQYLPTKSALFALLKNEPDKGGDWIKVIESNTVRRSTRAETAIAQRSTPAFRAFKVTTDQFGDEHSVVSVSTKTLRSTKDEENALVSAIEQAVDDMLKSMALAFDHKIATNGGGSKGVVKTGSISASTLQLDNAEHRIYWYEGMRVQGSDDNGTVNPGAGVHPGILEVSKIGVDGTITFTTTVAAGIPALGNGDFLFEEDDYDAGAKRILQGIPSWNPAAAPGSSDSHFGINRSINEHVFAGHRLTGGGAHIFDVLRAAFGGLLRGDPDTLLLSKMKNAEAEQAIGAKQEVMLTTQYPEIGVKGYKINAGGVSVDAVVTPFYDSTFSNLIKRDCIIVGSIGPFPHEVDDDGQTWRIEEGKAAVQSRQEGFIQTLCVEPWHNVAITW